MASTPLITHTVNGYSRYDVPETISFSATPGILYPARVEFLNARDRVRIQAGCVIRANPAQVPSFTPYRIRLHRFFCPMQLYHPEMRVNSSGFDLRNLSLNYLNTNIQAYNGAPADYKYSPLGGRGYYIQRSLLPMLRLIAGVPKVVGILNRLGAKDVDPEGTQGYDYVNADPVLAYWDVVRNYYAYSQVQRFSLAFPQTTQEFNGSIVRSQVPTPTTAASNSDPTAAATFLTSSYTSPSAYWQQYYARLDLLDRYFERSFYPTDTDREAPTFDRGDFIAVLINSLRSDSTITSKLNYQAILNTYNNERYIDTSDKISTGYVSVTSYSNFMMQFPLAVIPSSADRFSRLVPSSATSDISISNATTVTQLAIAARSQEYMDLLTAGDSRFTGWLRTFFGANLKHVDRPVLLYSSSFFLNSNPIFNQAASSENQLGEFGGIIQGQDTFGKRSQSYYFDEPGYIIDMLSIQPLYYWAGIQADYARYHAMDYFNPLFNELGYQPVPSATFGANNSEQIPQTMAKEPCFNEFRSSYDTVLGDLALVPGLPTEDQPSTILTSWVMQRYSSEWDQKSRLEQLVSISRFVSISDVNKPFASENEDNFFINMYYRVTRNSLVSKNFATRLSLR